MDGRLFWGEDEKAGIARELQTTVEDLYIPRTEWQTYAKGQKAQP